MGKKRAAREAMESDAEDEPLENASEEPSHAQKHGALVETVAEYTEHQQSSEILSTSGRGQPTLPWMRHPVDVNTFEDSPLQHVPCLDPRLVNALQSAGIKALFPVQVAVWRYMIGPGGGERDLCVCSPTGSGKTLAYSLPIVQMLSSRCIRRLRALVVLPTRDLAVQVKDVFDVIAPSVGLSVGLAIGQTPMVAEAGELVRFPGNYMQSCCRAEADELETVESSIDILVATPGRLMDHISSTRGFTLEHLCYLVVDETDRLLRQDYQDWLPNVLDAAYLKGNWKDSSAAVGPFRTIRHSGVERGFKGAIYPRILKMVLSATLTRDPVKLSKLNLYYPLYISSIGEGQHYKLPSQLEAYRLVCEASLKPLHLVALLQALNKQRTIVFTASVVTTHRLFLLLNCFENLPFTVVEFSSLQDQKARSMALAAFRAGDVDVLVASDAMTRGMDVEGVMNVVNYDVPVYAKTYVHRVGRTARAGRSGCSFTLLRKEEVKHFKEILRKSENSSCKNFKLAKESIDKLYPCYLKALEKLKEVTASET